MPEFIDVGSTYDSPVAMSDPDKPRKSYPTLCISCDSEMDIPSEGTMLIKFRKVEDVENTRDPDDPKFRYELEVQGVQAVEGEDDEVVADDPVEALEKAMKRSKDDE